MKKAEVVLLIVVCVTVAAIIALKYYDSVFVTRNAVAQTHSETQKYDNQTSTSQQANIQFVIDEKETPFLAKFWKLYENSDIGFYPVINARIACFSFRKDRFVIRCTKKDVDKMKELAAQGDFFSLAVLSFEREQPWFERALLEKEPVTTILEAKKYYFSEEYYDIEKTEKMLKSLEPTSPFISYLEQLKIYKMTDQGDKLCETAETAYNKFGIFAIGTFFIDKIEENDILFNHCNLFDKEKTKEEILKDINTDEAKLILGYKYVEDKRYNEAREIFEGFYISDDPVLSVSAGYCLGVMKYYGKGYPVDTAKGQELIKESHDNGYFYAYQAFPDKNTDIPFPVKDTITKHTVNMCERMARS
jgi:hypothetical protein